MRVSAIRGTHPRPADPASPAAEPVPAPTGRALVALTPMPAAPAPPAHYRQAPFLAQLIATKDQHPQTRERRRAAPHEALASYRATAALSKRH